MAKPSAVIFDIDGTLADNSHRRHYVEGKPKNWDAFYEGMSKDLGKTNSIKLLDMAYSGDFEKVIFVTGRPEKYRAITLKWLSKWCSCDCCAKELFMRPDGDHTPDDVLKKKIYLEMIEPHFDVKLVVDDRDRVVKMWRSLGLECWQVAEGNF